MMYHIEMSGALILSQNVKKKILEAGPTLFEYLCHGSSSITNMLVLTVR